MLNVRNAVALSALEARVNAIEKELNQHELQAVASFAAVTAALQELRASHVKQAVILATLVTAANGATIALQTGLFPLVH